MVSRGSETGWDGEAVFPSLRRNSCPGRPVPINRHRCVRLAIFYFYSYLPGSEVEPLRWASLTHLLMCKCTHCHHHHRCAPIAPTQPRQPHSIFGPSAVICSQPLRLKIHKHLRGTIATTIRGTPSSPHGSMLRFRSAHTRHSAIPLDDLFLLINLFESQPGRDERRFSHEYSAEPSLETTSRQPLAC